jgi:UrcA family protein
MNTVNTAKGAIKTLLISTIALGAFGGAAAMADQVGPSVLTKTLSFQDLDLSTVQGQQIARGRVHQMARVLCNRVADPTDMSHHKNYLACVDATVAKAGESLQGVINKQSTAHLARADAE